MNELTGNLKVTQIWESLDKIASKIGMTVEQLWPYLVKQVYNEAMLGAIAIFVFACISIFILLKYGELRFSKWSEMIPDSKQNLIKDSAKTCTIIPLIILGLFMVVFIFKVLPRFFNPEYFAFQDLMYMLK